MDIERHFITGPEGRAIRAIAWNDLPPTQAGLAAALRRAYTLPAEDDAPEFDELLRKLAC